MTAVYDETARRRGARRCLAWSPCAAASEVKVHSGPLDKQLVSQGCRSWSEDSDLRAVVGEVYRSRGALYVVGTSIPLPRGANTALVALARKQLAPPRIGYRGEPCKLQPPP